jgi:hypothetical protein
LEILMLVTVLLVVDTNGRSLSQLELTGIIRS